MSIRLVPHVRSLQALRERLLGSKRGVGSAFKLALGEAVHYWQMHYADLHFREGTLNRYGSGAYYAKYAGRRQHGAGQVGSQGRASVNRIIEALGRSYYSSKEAKQVNRGLPVNNSPLVFTGLTREGITGRDFTTRGTSKKVRGSWNDQRINYRGLHARGGIGREFLLRVNNQEWEFLSGYIETMFNRYLAEYVNQDRPLPSLSDLPIFTK
jgi:hypothetical protein